MFCFLLGRRFSGKIKHSVKRINRRKDAIRKKKQAVVRYLRKDVADLLAGGHEAIAFSRMDALIIEINYADCYDMIEQYCGCVLEHLPTIRKGRECPKEAMEAIATLIFAAARFANMPELGNLRTAFTERYGTGIYSCVNREFVGKTRRRSSSKEKKLKLMEDIAQEFSICWNAKMFERKISSKTAPTDAQLPEDNLVIKEDANGNHEPCGRDIELSPKPLIQNHQAFNHLHHDECRTNCMPLDQLMIREPAKARVDHGEFTHSKTSEDVGDAMHQNGQDRGRDRPTNVENFRPSHLQPPYVKSNAKNTPLDAICVDPRGLEKSYWGLHDDRIKCGSVYPKLWDYEILASQISALRTS